MSLFTGPTKNNLGPDWDFLHPLTDAFGITDEKARHQEQAQAIVAVTGATCSAVCGIMGVITTIFATIITALIVGCVSGFAPALITIGVGLGIVGLISIMTCCCAAGCLSTMDKST